MGVGRKKNHSINVQLTWYFNISYLGCLVFSMFDKYDSKADYGRGSDVTTKATFLPVMRNCEIIFILLPAKMYL